MAQNGLCIAVLPGLAINNDLPSGKAVGVVRYRHRYIRCGGDHFAELGTADNRERKCARGFSGKRQHPVGIRYKLNRADVLSVADKNRIKVHILGDVKRISGIVQVVPARVYIGLFRGPADEIRGVISAMRVIAHKICVVHHRHGGTGHIRTVLIHRRYRFVGIGSSVRMVSHLVRYFNCMADKDHVCGDALLARDNRGFGTFVRPMLV